MSTPKEANTLREEGNCLYKDGKLVEAIHKYQEAAKLVPGDSAPLRNLSAAFYEIGYYKECIAKAQQALSIIQADGGDDMLRQVETLESRIEKAKVQSYQASSDDQLQRRRKVLQNIPRYRPNMLPNNEYYTVGHDQAASMFDPMIERANPKGKRASFLFGGIGDSRHMLRTIIEIAKHEGASKKLYHFTVNDINNYAITRDLIIWMLIRDLSETTEDSDEAALIANTLVFVYFGTMIPGRAFERLHQTIDEAFSALKAGKQPLKWAHLYKKDVPAYLRVLKMWKGRALKIYTNSEVIDRVTEDMKTRRGADPDFVYQVPLACKKEKLLYIHAAVFYPSPRFLELFDPEMQVLLEKFSGKPKANAERFKDHLRKHWRVNTTLISPDWWDELDNKAEYDFSHDPFEAIDSFKRPSMETFLLSLLDQSTETPTETSFYEFLAPFFANVADAIKVLQGRIQVEVLHDEFVDICEEIRFGVYPKEHGRRTKAADVELRPKNFPVTFDRIHMSNVPDYIGGHLSTFLYAMPLLESQFSSMAMSNCLRNTTRWDSMDDFVAEYQCITDDDMLEKLTSVLISHKGTPPYPCGNYTAYKPSYMPSPPNLRRNFSDLLPRKPFNKWFYAIFFKLALPFNCDIRYFQVIIYAPLNFTIIFRLLCQLRLLGYPSHWLSEALTNILDDKVITSARPPWKLPMKVPDVKHDYPEKKLTTAPFRQEFATLTQLFQPLLPFSLASRTIPPLSTIHSYTIAFPSYTSYSSQQTCLLLVFYNPLLFPSMSPRPSTLTLSPTQAPPPSLRPLLDPSPASEIDPSFCGPQYTRFREEGVACWTSFSWDAASRTARAWMSTTLVDKLVKEDWCCALWRVDLWCPVAGGGIGGGEGKGTKSCKVADIVVKGEAWHD